MLKKHIPTATYRIQFNADFPLKNAFKLIGYLNNLGISDIYSSPLTKAAPGSKHGYDVIDPTKLNPEICDFKILKQFADLLHQKKMALLLDFVPNHMAASNHNRWWRDVVKKAKASPYAHYFDINWRIKDKLSYRRFFDINELVCLRIEDQKVFNQVHTLVKKLISENIIDGLRIDHIDGLLDPGAYLSYLKKSIQKIIRKDLYVIVEKILAADETIPPQWGIEGTTGYDFLDAVNGLFIDKNGYDFLVKDYKKFTGLKNCWIDVRYQSKKQVINELFQEELQKLVESFKKIIARSSNRQADHFKTLLTEVSAILPVYRTYVRNFVVRQSDCQYLIKTCIQTKKKIGAESSEALLLLKKILTMKHNFQSRKNLKWIMNWQQFTGPVMAKGFEDTACYRYNPLISLNEVGSDPRMEKNYGDPKILHKFLKSRQRCNPYSLNATSTHDTKRSEDVRMRLNVLSELAEEWVLLVKNWSQIVQPLKIPLAGMLVPDANLEILLYQSLLGAWPITKERVSSFAIKAVREAKIYSSWNNPNTNYETALLFFIDALIQNRDFIDSFLPFQKKIAFHGALNSLGEVLIKITAPGIPDFYQGTESWSFTLVDPDNRSPVEFSKNRQLLSKLVAIGFDNQELLAALCKNWPDGNIKLFLTQKSLQFRRDHLPIFQLGQYIPLAAIGIQQQNVFSFCRVYQSRWILIAIPRFTTRLCSKAQFPLGKKVWRDTQLILPKNAPRHWRSIFTDAQVTANENNDLLILDVHPLLASFPVAFFKSE
ncbi:MAG: malto-oligosyltrehalose synthase [Proteobacteria bacterium]|nr:malto-oligosyltrehalose synthase [Pseudomonadota bacterium]